MATLPLSLTVRTERWPIAGAFSISRGAKTEAVVVVAELNDGRHHGRGECVPYARYGETVEGVAAPLAGIAHPIAQVLRLRGLHSAVERGGARECGLRAVLGCPATHAGSPGDL